MPNSLLPMVGRRSWWLRLVIGFIYVVLIGGAVTMVYPFALMVSSSLTSNLDFWEFRLVPRYVWDDSRLRVKDLNARYAELDFEAVRTRYQLAERQFRSIATLPEPDLNSAGAQRQLADWREFKLALPSELKTVFYYDVFMNGKVQRMYQDHLQQLFGGDLAAYNRTFRDHARSFQDIDIVREKNDGHTTPPHGETGTNHAPPSIGVHEVHEQQGNSQSVPAFLSPQAEWEKFKAQLPAEWLLVFTADELWVPYLESKYERIEVLNGQWGTQYGDFVNIAFPRELPTAAGLREDWVAFLRRRYPLRFMALSGGEEEYRKFLAAKFGTVEKFNRLYTQSFSDWQSVPLARSAPQELKQFALWGEFISSESPEYCPPQYLALDNAETRYAAFLHDRYGTVAQVNQAYGTNYAGWPALHLPVVEEDYAYFMQHRRALRLDFLLDNYRRVLRFITLKGHALFNTLILVMATILTQLTVNPMAAFALSRFRLSYANKILIFLLATMAFPGEVAMIPNFLLTKEMHLLNTYWALILPGLASGFSIFLLKGFFDSLPRELYEAALIDGASEMTIFRRITLPLSKPILAVVALGAFTAAYGSFLWALLICQDPRMWTLMVSLYEFQIQQPQSVVMASLVIAAIPTLLVFMLCQNIILRGIIVPISK